MPRRKKSDEGIMDITRMAEDLGVSKTTVSRALSGNGRVSEATRQRVVDYAREKNYVPNMMAKSLVTKKSYNVALVFSRQFSNFEGQFLRKTITAVCDVMARNDYDVLLAMVGEQESQPMQRLLVNHKIDGVILVRSLERDPLIPLLQQSKLPFIAIGRPADPTVLYVDHDQVGGCREMTNLLLMKGLHRIALLGGSMLYTVNQTRLEGFRQAHEHSRCKIDETLLFLELETDDLRIDAIQQAVARKADCLLCMDDHVAMLALNTVRQMGLKVPDDIRIASLYDGEALLDCTPQITAVSFDPELLGKRAAQQLLAVTRRQPVETGALLGYQVGLRTSTQT